MPGNGIQKKVMLDDGIKRVVVGGKRRLTRAQIAQRAALELPDGAYVNLGWEFPISLPTICRKRSRFISTAKMGFWEWDAAQNLAKKISIRWTR